MRSTTAALAGIVVVTGGLARLDPGVDVVSSDDEDSDSSTVASLSFVNSAGGDDTLGEGDVSSGNRDGSGTAIGASSSTEKTSSLSSAVSELSSVVFDSFAVESCSSDASDSVSPNNS